MDRIESRGGCGSLYFIVVKGRAARSDQVTFTRMLDDVLDQGGPRA